MLRASSRTVAETGQALMVPAPATQTTRRCRHRHPNPSQRRRTRAAAAGRPVNGPGSQPARVEQNLIATTLDGLVNQRPGASAGAPS